MLSTIAGFFIGNPLEKIATIAICVAVIAMMVFGSGVEININSKNWVKQSIRVRNNKRVVDHNRKRILRDQPRLTEGSE